ncbi:thiamine phosphate synthase [Terricaulis sp.]|uniref:thiamine phosphate synthase n=1 Tax=Terricaulis sp. TaxID=2768686 RepID=UPI002AC43D5E|nr:thiamine phosphate synthase [Terricaulis sp.]MDZ4691083.1 thiamine phosphate synthase [Terricaulis sp.]
MSSIHALAGLARRLNHERGAPAIPSLFFVTDPERTPDPLAVARRLPRGTAIIYRHFGAPERAQIARNLASIARSRGLVLLIAADPTLAQRVGADGVHWPQVRLPRTRSAGLVTAAAHDADSLTRAANLGVDACLLAPVLPTNSSSGNAPLGLFRAGQLAQRSAVPVIALGGITADTAKRLAGRGFAGCAGVEAFA